MSVELFNSLLKQSLNESNVKMPISINNDQNNNTSTEKVCLITGEPLTEKYITLKCNHSFNYISLMNERIQWKGNYKNSGYCYSNNIMMQSQMVCPYCRSVTDGILPWFKQINGMAIPKKRGVNWPKKYWFLPDTCIYKFVSGKKKGQCCGKKSFGSFCTQHDKKRVVKKKMFCEHVLSRGKRKGLYCHKNAKQLISGGSELGYYCSNHMQKYKCEYIHDV